jgi:hypothetical protein
MFAGGRLQSVDRLLPRVNAGRRALQSVGPASSGDMAGVFRRALQAQVVVHAPTLAGAQELLCR